MDKFELALLAQLKEHNRLTKELVKLQQAVINEPKKVSTEIFWSEPAGYPGMYKCTKCGEMELTASKFCPNCGAKMYSEGNVAKVKKFSIDEMYYILVNHGQKDPRFKFGDTIKYSPSEIKRIFSKETEKEGEDDA